MIVQGVPCGCVITVASLHAYDGSVVVAYAWHQVIELCILLILPWLPRLCIKLDWSACPKINSCKSH